MSYELFLFSGLGASLPGNPHYFQLPLCFQCSPFLSSSSWMEHSHVLDNKNAVACLVCAKHCHTQTQPGTINH